MRSHPEGNLIFNIFSYARSHKSSEKRATFDGEFVLWGGKTASSRGGRRPISVDTELGEVIQNLLVQCEGAL